MTCMLHRPKRYHFTTVEVPVVVVAVVLVVGVVVVVRVIVVVRQNFGPFLANNCLPANFIFIMIHSLTFLKIDRSEDGVLQWPVGWFQHYY